MFSPEANGGITGSITQDSFKRVTAGLDDEPGNPYDFSKDTFVSLNLKVFVWQELSNIHVLVRKIFGLGRWSLDCSNDGAAGTKTKNYRCSVSGAAETGLKTTIKYLRSAASFGPRSGHHD